MGKKRSEPMVMPKEDSMSFTVEAPKGRDIFMQALIARGGAGAGKHKSKATRGSGKHGQGKAQRHKKHKGRDW
jgi:hypothetical protein